MAHQPLAGHSSAAGTHESGYGMYVRTWVWLLIITLLEVGVAWLDLPRALTVGLLVVLALMKATLIMATFMHLRFERLQFIYAVLSPLILVIALLAGLAGDAVKRFS